MHIDTGYLTVQAKTLSGEVRSYQFCKLRHREAAEVLHNTLQAVIVSLAEMFSAMSPGEFGGLSNLKLIPIDKVLSVAKQLDFGTVWGLASVLLRNAVLDNQTIGPDIDKTDYFTGRHDELYIALYHAVKENYPELFLALPGLSDILAKKQEPAKAGSPAE